MSEGCLATFRVVFQGAHRTSIGHAHHQGNMPLSLSPGAESGGVAFQLVQQVIGKPGELHFRHRFQASQGHADGTSIYGGLCNGRVNDSLLAVLVDKTVCYAKNSSVKAHILAQQNDPVVPGHLLVQGEVQGLHHIKLSHRLPPFAPALRGWQGNRPFAPRSPPPPFQTRGQKGRPA